MLVLVTGGARSGKSSFAEAYASRLANKGIYIATAQAYDEEMKERIGLHRKQRDEAGFPWTTIEESFELDGLLQRWSEEAKWAAEAQAASQPSHPAGVNGSVVLVDCLTLWLSNWLLRYEQEANAEQLVKQKIDGCVAACRRFTDQGHQLVLVTNEVGYGLVPEYKLGRQFRDLSGIMNQRLAREAEQVFLVTAGIPMEIKSRRFQW